MGGHIVLFVTASILTIIVANPVAGDVGIQLACAGKMETRGSGDPISEAVSACRDQRNHDIHELPAVAMWHNAERRTFECRALSAHSARGGISLSNRRNRKNMLAKLAERRCTATEAG
jgi:hypothetical protein